MIVVSAGHYPAQPGACYPGAAYCEHAVASEWVAVILNYLQLYERCAAVPPGPLGAKVAWINTIRPLPILAVEIHFNSDMSKSQHGSETLFCPRSAKGESVARVVQGALGRIMLPSRGVKEGWYQMDKPGHVDFPGDVEGDESVDYFLKVTACPAVILEPEFIYNRHAIESNRDAACEAIAIALHSAADTLRRVQP